MKTNDTSSPASLDGPLERAVFPEQLRARLSAFQSATARGRVEGQDETSSTWTPPAMDYVPDSAPQAR